MITNQQGPVSKFLQATGKSREQFEADLRSGEPYAASIFAADVLFGAIQDLATAIENRPEK